MKSPYFLFLKTKNKKQFLVIKHVSCVFFFFQKTKNYSQEQFPNKTLFSSKVGWFINSALYCKCLTKATHKR